MLELQNRNEINKHLVIGVNATNDINPSQNFELKGNDVEVYLVDSFELFFKNPENAKNMYSDIFYDIKRILKEEESTKLSIFSHRSNANKIRKGKSDEFKIYITVKEGYDEIEYNLGTLNNDEELENNLEKLGLADKGIDTTSLGLKGIANSEKGNGYIRLFNYGVGGGTHNIASSITSFSKVINSKWFKVISPNMVDDSREYTSRTSLFLVDKNGEKCCIRTNANQEQLDVVYNEVIENKEKISDILVTSNKGLHLEGVRKHSVPTNFDENVFHNVLTVVFNCEDREMGVVIDAVIYDAVTFLEANNLDFEVKIYLGNLLNILKSLSNKLSEANSDINIKKRGINLKYEYINEIKGTKSQLIYDEELSKIPRLKKEINDLGIIRLNILKEVLVVLIEITKITESNIEQEPDENGLGRVVLITDGEDGSVGSIESNNHEVFFTNTIWNIGKYEKRFFKILNSLSKGQIDLETKDTTGCGDSSTAAAIMIREADGLTMRKEKYLEIFAEMGVPEESYERAISIMEAYFLSHFQEVISGVIYHCKKSNLGDIPSSDKVTKFILGYVFNNTIIFAKYGMKKFIYSNDNSIVTDGRTYEGFNVNKISELR